MVEALCRAQLYEEVCIAEGCTDLGCAKTGSSPATILLLPPQFSIINETRLPHLVRTIRLFWHYLYNR